jgi:hypothetical protein
MLARQYNSQAYRVDYLLERICTDPIETIQRRYNEVQVRMTDWDFDRLSEDFLYDVFKITRGVVQDVYVTGTMGSWEELFKKRGLSGR